DALRQNARLRHVVDALDLDVLEIGPVRRLVPEPMGQVVELKPHVVLEVLLEHHATNSLRHCYASCAQAHCFGGHDIQACPTALQNAEIKSRKERWSRRSRSKNTSSARASSNTGIRPWQRCRPPSASGCWR